MDRTQVSELIARATDWLSDDSLTNEEVEGLALEAASDQMLARRVLDWIPEVFGMVYARHLWNIEMPKQFTVQNRTGAAKTFDFKEEVLFVPILELAMDAYHGELRQHYASVANQSSIFASITKALDAGLSLEGAKFDSLKFNGIPAEFYEKRPWWRVFWERSRW